MLFVLQNPPDISPPFFTSECISCESALVRKAKVYLVSGMNTALLLLLLFSSVFLAFS